MGSAPDGPCTTQASLGSTLELPDGPRLCGWGLGCDCPWEASGSHETPWVALLELLCA